MTGGTDTCDRCGVEYESYAVLLTDDFNEVSGYVECEYDNLCKPCRMHVADYGAYLTEAEREQIEPKVSVDDDGA